jgi:hypothetical protein
VGSRTFTIPYGTGELEIVGRVESVTDTLYTVPGANGTIQRWKGVEFSVIANDPTKEAEVPAESLGPIIPDIQVPIGTIVEYTEDGWVQREPQAEEGEGD